MFAVGFIYVPNRRNGCCGKALSYDFDVEILHPHGVGIDLPFWVFKRLKKVHLPYFFLKSGFEYVEQHAFSCFYAPNCMSDQKGHQDLLTDPTSNKYPLLPLRR
jgi:hypothetical protein